MDLINSNDSYINELWDDYSNKRELGLKKEANNLLMILVEYLQSLDDEKLVDFVKMFCYIKFDEGRNLKLQYPLSKNIIFPVLMKNSKKNKVPEMRWLYQLGFIDKDCESKINNNFTDRLSLLESARQHGNCDEITLDLLMKAYLYSLWYGSHHLPEICLTNEDEVADDIRKLHSIMNELGINKESEIGIEIKHYEMLYKTWFEYKRNPKNETLGILNEFLEKGYGWIKSYYYDSSK